MASAAPAGLRSYLSYSSVKLIKVHNTTLALIYYAIALLVLLYVVVFTIIVKKGYQEYDTLVGSTMIKVKGSAHIGEGENVTIYDANDLVPPPLSPETLFITTNSIVTFNQSRHLCDGNDPETELCNCTQFRTVEQCCQAGQHTINGMKTGRCGANGTFCELRAWCPLEEPKPDLSANILNGVRNWTVFVRANVRFPLFGVSKTNVRDKLEPGVNFFVVDDMLTKAGATFDDVKTRGGIFVTQFQYNCDLNQDLSKCEPEIHFTRLDSPSQAGISEGFNYRTITNRVFRNTAYRDLTKVFGLRFIFEVVGTGGKFSVFPLFVTLGAGLALLSISTLVCDVIMQYLLPNKFQYIHEKYQEVDEPEEDRERSDSGYVSTGCCGRSNRGAINHAGSHSSPTMRSALLTTEPAQV